MGLIHHAARHYERIWDQREQLLRGGPQSAMLQSAAPETRLTSAMLLVLAAALTHHWELLLAIVFLSGVGALAAGMSAARFLLTVMGIAAATVGLLALPAMLHVITPGPVFLEVGPAKFTVSGLEVALRVYLRGLASLCIVMLLIRSAGFPGILSALRTLRAPEALLTALRLAAIHLQVLGSTLQTMLAALRTRTIVRRLGLTSHYRIAGFQASQLLRKSLTVSRTVHSAMLARGFHGQFPVPPRVRPAYRLVDAIIVAIGAACLAVAVLLR